MAETERIQLILDVSGVQDVAQLKQSMEDLAQAMGVADYKFEATGAAAEKAADAIDDLADAAESAGGGEGGGKGGGKKGKSGKGSKDRTGQNLLTLAYAVDDLQYGLRGVMNNIPGVVQALGLGAGFAGVAGVAAVAVGQLVERHPEWFEWSEKVRDKLKELVDVLEDEAEAVKKQKEQVEKLGETNRARTADLIKLKQATDDLKQAESDLAADRDARKAAEDAAKNKGVADAESLAKNRQVFTDYAVDPGNAEDVMLEMRRRLQADPNLRGAASEAAGVDPFSDQSDDDLLAEIFAEEQVQLGMGGMDAAEAKKLFRANPRLKEQARKQYGNQVATRRQFKTQQYDENLVGNIFGRLSRTAKTGEDFGKAFRGFAAIMPNQAGMLERERAERAGDEEFDRGNEAWRQGAGPRRRRAEASAAADKAEQDRLDSIVDDFTGQTVAERAAARRRAEREASARESAVNQAMMNQEPWQNRFIMARNAAIQNGRNPVQVNQLADRNNAAVMNEMREGFEKAGFNQEQATAATQRVTQSVMQSLQRMLQTGQASLDAYGRIQVTVQNLERQIDAQAAEWSKAAWQGGMRDR